MDLLLHPAEEVCKVILYPWYVIYVQLNTVAVCPVPNVLCYSGQKFGVCSALFSYVVHGGDVVCFDQNYPVFESWEGRLLELVVSL